MSLEIMRVSGTRFSVHVLGSNESKGRTSLFRPRMMTDGGAHNDALAHLSNAADIRPLTGPGKKYSVVSIVDPQIKKLEDIFKTGSIEWTKKVTKTDENMKKVKNSIPENRRVLTELAQLIDANEPLYAHKDKIIKAIDLVFTEQGMKLRADAKLYPIHPMQAAVDFIKKLGITDPDLILSAILHDFVEDVNREGFDAQKSIKEAFGEKVLANVLSVTNKELSNNKKEVLKSFIAKKLLLDLPSARLDTVVKVFEYQLGVIQEIGGKPDTLLLKSVDLGGNALTQKNLASDTQLQARLSMKYGSLLTVFADHFEVLAKKESQKKSQGNKALIDGLNAMAEEYRIAFDELKSYSNHWEFHDLHSESLCVINKYFGGLERLAAAMKRSSRSEKWRGHETTRTTHHRSSSSGDSDLAGTDFGRWRGPDVYEAPEERSDGFRYPGTTHIITEKGGWQHKAETNKSGYTER